MAWNDPVLDEKLKGERASAPRRGLDLGAFDATRAEASSRQAAISDEYATGASELAIEHRKTLAQPGFPQTELAFNDLTGEWAVQASDGSVRVVDKAPATLFALSDMPLKKIESLPEGFRPVSQEELRNMLSQIPEDSDFWGEMGASFKTSIGLAASAIDALIGNDDPSNAWSRSAKDYTERQTIGQYKASQGAWYESLPGFTSGLGQTVGNLAGNVAAAAPAIAAGTAMGGPAGSVTGAGLAISGAAGAAGEQATDYYDATMEAMAGMTEDELLDDSPLYQQARAEGLSDADARKQVAIEGARVAMAPAAGLGALEGYIGGRLGRGLLARLGNKTVGRAAGSTLPGKMGRILDRPIAGALPRGIGGAIAAGTEEVAETSLSQAAGAAYTGIGNTDPRSYMSGREFEEASQGGFILGALGGGRSRADAARAGIETAEDLVAGQTGAMADLGSAMQTAGRQSPNDAPAFLRRGVSGIGDPNGQGSLGLDVPYDFDMDREAQQPPSAQSFASTPQEPAAAPPAAGQQDLFNTPQPAPAQVQAEQVAQRQMQAQATFTEITGLQSPEEVQANMPELLQLADENPSFKALMDEAGITPMLIEQSPESQQAAAASAQQQFAQMPAPAPNVQPAVGNQIPVPPGAEQSVNMASRARGPESAQRAAVQMAVPQVDSPEPIAPPTERTPDGRPVGVTPAAAVNPEPMDPEQARQAAQTRAGRRAKAGAPPSPVDEQAGAVAAPVSPDGVTPSTPEPAGDIAAQVEALLDPETARTAVFVADGNEAAIPADLPPDAIVVSRRGRGSLITLDPTLGAKFLRGKWTDADTQKALGYSENKGATNVGGVVVEARTPEGEVAAQQLATDTPRNRRAAAAAVKAQARKDATVATTTPQAAQAERAARAAEPPRNVRAAAAAESRAARTKPTNESAVGQTPARERKLGPKAKAVLEKTAEKKSPQKAVVERAPRKEALNDQTREGRQAAGATASRVFTPAPRMDVSRAARKAPGEVRTAKKSIAISSGLVDTGRKGSVIDLRQQAIDTANERQLRETLEAGSGVVMDARELAKVERALLEYKQMHTLMREHVAEAEQRLRDRAEQTPDGAEEIARYDADQLQREQAQRIRTRKEKGESAAGRPATRTQSSLLSHLPLLASEAMDFGRSVREQLQATVKDWTTDNAEVSRRLLEAIVPPGLVPALQNESTLKDVVTGMAKWDDQTIDNHVISAMPQLRHSLLAKQVMRGLSEVAYVTRRESMDDSQNDTVRQGKHVRSFEGDLPKETAKLVDGWLDLMERGGVKIQGEVHVLSMDTARDLYPDDVPAGKMGHYAMRFSAGKPFHVLAVDWEAVGHEAVAIEVLAHEFGELLGRQVFNRSDRDTQDAVLDSYHAWLNTTGRLSPSEIFRSHAPALLGELAAEGNQLSAEYATSFSEWLSNHVARYMLNRQEPKGLVEKYFARIGDILRKVWDALRGNERPDSAVAEMLDMWQSGKAAANEVGPHRVQTVAGSMEWLGSTDPDTPPGRRLAEAVVRHTTAPIAAGKQVAADAITAAWNRDTAALNDMGDSLYNRMMGSQIGAVLRRTGLSLMTLDQIERRFRSSPLGQSLTAWVRLQKAKAQLANVALNGGTYTMPDNSKLTLTGAADVLERANQLSSKARDVLTTAMYYATHYSVHPDANWESNKNRHLREGSDQVVASNRRRYLHVANLWEQLGNADPGAQQIYKDLRDAFYDLHEKTLAQQIKNIEDSEFSERAKNEAIEKIKAYRRTLRTGPYFPLMRFGDWVVSVWQPSEATFYKTAAEAQQARRDQKAMNPGARVEVKQEDGEWSVRVFRRGVYFFESANAARDARPQIEADLREQIENAGLDYDEVRAAVEQGKLDDEETRGDLFISEPKEKAAIYEAYTGNSEFISELRAEAKAKGLRVDPELQQIMENLYIESLPEFSARKSMLPRQNVMGASRDMLKSYAMRFQGAAHAFSGVTYAQDIGKAWRGMQDVRNKGGFEPSQAVMNNLLASQEAIAARMKDTIGNKISNFVTDASSLFSLAFSPAYILTNAMQPMMITLPTLAGVTYRNASGATETVGAARAMAYLKDAYEGTVPFFSKRGLADFVDESKRLFGQKSAEDGLHKSAEVLVLKFGKTDAERRMLTRMLESGRLDFSFLNSIEDAMRGGKLSQKFGTVARLGMALPQQVEAMNRVVTALASYRLAQKELGFAEPEAIEYAYDVVGDTQLDYSRMNRPLVFNKPFLSVLLQFKLYMQGMYALFVRNSYLALKGATPEEKAQGRKTLMYLLGTHGAIGGATGLGPLVFLPKLAIGLAAMLMGREGDDDEWKSSEQLFAEKARFVFGDKAGQVAERGLPTLLGLDVADRIGIPILADTKFTGIKETDDAGSQIDKWTLYSLGAPYANIRRVVKAGGAAVDDDPYTKISDGLPAGPRAMFRALSTAKDGIVDRDGDTFISADQLGWRDIAFTAAGFQPTTVSRGYRERSEEKGTMARIQADKQLLLKKWRTAEPSEKPALREEIKAFNANAPKPFQIRAEALSRSVKAKAARDQGVVNRNEAAVREYLK